MFIRSVSFPYLFCICSVSILYLFDIGSLSILFCSYCLHSISKRSWNLFEEQGFRELVISNTRFKLSPYKIIMQKFKQETYISVEENVSPVSQKILEENGIVMSRPVRESFLKQCRVTGSLCDCPKNRSQALSTPLKKYRQKTDFWLLYYLYMEYCTLKGLSHIWKA